MDTLLPLTVVGLVTGCIYAITAAGLVVTYTTTGIFNFAHGALGMIAAFAYWEMAMNRGWPQPLALILVVFVLAPLTGVVIEGLLMRPVRGLGLDATLTVSLGLLLFLIGLATVVWDPTKPRIIYQFFRGNSVTLFGVNVSAHQIVVVAAAVLVAVLLRVFLYATRSGTALRALVDNPELISLAGASPGRYGQMGWAIGSMLAALAGVLLAPLITLDTVTLTVLVINGYAAAMVGRLRNLPWTFVGGLALGLMESYLVGYLPVGTWLSQVKPTVPMAFLLVALIVLPERRIAGRRPAIRMPRVAGIRESLIAGAVLVVLALVVAPMLSDSNLRLASHGVALGLVMLSLVLITGYGGQVSLCQLTFAGVGAFAMGKVAGGGSWWGLLAAMALAGAVGCVVSLPALRLRGLYIALATLAFAQAMETAFFRNVNTFGTSGSLQVGRVDIPGLSMSSETTYFVVLCAVFALISVGLLALRRSTLGRRLTAAAESPSASATLGMNLTATRLITFGLSAALAGLAGALYGGQQGVVGATDFTLLTNLTLLLMAVVWGVRSPAGMLLAGISLSVFPKIQSEVPALRNLLYLAIGLAAIGIGRNPNGVIGGNTPLQAWRDHRARAASRGSHPAATNGPTAETANAAG